MTDPADIRIRPLATREECEACVRLQRETWGGDFVDVVPATILMVSQRVGGVAVGAFDPDEELLGFVFGISGVRRGELAHWSDMLAVRPDVRRCGVGTRLKLYQRQSLLDQGITVAFWSFDPLVARNARFNVLGLGAEPVEYVVNMYGNNRSVLHRGLDTDRLVVEWRLSTSRVTQLLAGQPEALSSAWQAAPLITSALLAPPSAPGDGDLVLPNVRDVRVAVPADIEQLKTMDPDKAKRWQIVVRKAFLRYFEEGYRVVGFSPPTESQHGWYALTRLAGS